MALLPLRNRRAALVWCVDRDDDPVAGLDNRQRELVLGTLFDPEVGRIQAISALKCFPLGLNAERSLTEGRIVRIGNAAQTLHPVAGQGLNLGLRDAHELVRSLRRDPDPARVLRRLEWKRGPDRWSMIFATDFLARSFTWALPGAPRRARHRHGRTAEARSGQVAAGAADDVRVALSALPLLFDLEDLGVQSSLPVSVPPVSSVAPG